MQRFAYLLFLFAILWAISGMREVDTKTKGPNKAPNKGVVKVTKKTPAKKENLLKKPKPG